MSAFSPLAVADSADSINLSKNESLLRTVRAQSDDKRLAPGPWRVGDETFALRTLHSANASSISAKDRWAIPPIPHGSIYLVVALMGAAP